LPVFFAFGGAAATYHSNQLVSNHNDHGKPIWKMNGTYVCAFLRVGHAQNNEKLLQCFRSSAG
jgi:hypothetical protein